MRRPPASRVPSVGWLVAAHVALAAAWGVAVPSFEKPDEPGHFEVARFLVTHHRLPRPLPAGKGVECPWEFHHPPLYHALAGTLLAAVDPTFGGELRTDLLRNTFYARKEEARRAAARPAVPRLNLRGPLFGGPEAGFFRRDPRDTFPWAPPYRGVRLLRLAGLAVGALTVLAVARLAAVVLGEGPWAFAATAFVALNPQVCFLMTSISNDGLAALLGALVTLAAIRIARRDDRCAGSPLAVAGLGLALGLALLTRMTLLALVPFTVACLWVASRRDRSTFVRLALGCCGVAGAVAGWWFVRNTVVYGDPLAQAACLVANAGLTTHRWIGSRFFWLPREDGFVSRTFQSYWGFFGWMSLPQSRRIAVQLAVVCVTGAAGAMASWRSARHSRSAATTRDRTTLALLAFHIALSIALVVNLNLTYTSPQGRYLFGSLGPVSILVVLGLRHWSTRLGWRRPGIAAAWSLPAYLLVVNAVDLVGILHFYATSSSS